MSAYAGAQSFRSVITLRTYDTRGNVNISTRASVYIYFLLITINFNDYHGESKIYGEISGKVRGYEIGNCS